MTRAALIINPVSGDEVSNTEKVAFIQASLIHGPFALELHYTTPELSAAKIARAIVASGIGSVIVCGGDGTISEVARELVHRPVSLGVIPMGTYNNIARSLGIPEDLAIACSIVTDGYMREIDVGRANEDKYFFEAAGAGMDAALFPIGKEIKRGNWLLIFKAARLISQYRAAPIEITLNVPLREALPEAQKQNYSPKELAQCVVRRNALFTVVANGPYYGGAYTVAPGARLSDRRLTVSLYRDFSKLELLRHFHTIRQGRLHFHRKIETYYAREVRLSSSKPLPVHVDGLPFGCLPVKFEAIARALRVFSPVRKR